jgi:hypothetical protein
MDDRMKTDGGVEWSRRRFLLQAWHLRFELLDRSMRSTALRISSHTVLPLEPR